MSAKHFDHEGLHQLHNVLYGVVCVFWEASKVWLFVVLAGSEEKLAVCSRYGADVVVNYKTQDFAVAVLSVTGDKGKLVLRPAN